VRLSICIPTYQRAALLDKCLEHLSRLIADKNVPGDVELCLSDNASADDTPAVIEKHRSAFAEFKTVRQPVNRGFSANLLATAELATGDYLLFHGDDDRMTAGSFTLIFDAIGRGGAVTFFATLPDRGLFGQPAVDPHRHVATFADGFEAIGQLGIFHPTFIGNFIVRRTDYLAFYEERFTQSLYPHVNVLLKILQHSGGEYVPEPLFEFDESPKTWNQPLLSAVDLSRVMTDTLFAQNPRHPLVRAVYGQLVRSIGRAIYNEKKGRKVDYANPYQSLHPSNLAGCYRHSPQHVTLAIFYWAVARLLPASLLIRLIGERPRKVHFE
jgi:glycosyltransferase involved in cell wall biosynthesis